MLEDVFPIDKPNLPLERSVAMEIDLEEGEKRVAKLALQFSPAEMNKIKKADNSYTRRGVDYTDCEPWGAPVLFAPKNNGDLRMCLDYRALNMFSINNNCPISRSDEIFDQHQGA
jgi:hypothetical protein